MTRLNKNYTTEDKYRHQLGILRSIMRRLGMTENAPLSEIPNELNKQLDIIGEATEVAVDWGTAFIQVMPDGSRRILSPKDVVLHVIPWETSTNG